MATATAAAALVTLFRDGNYLGRIEADGGVIGVHGKMGDISFSGEVRDIQGEILGSSDDSGLVLNASGGMCGMVDASGNVWAGDELLGQVVGTEAYRGGAALLLLLRDEPAISLTSEQNVTEANQYAPRKEIKTVREIAALPPKPRSNRFVYGFAHIAVLGGIVWGLWCVVSWGINSYRQESAARSAVSVTRVTSSTPAPIAIDQKKRSATQVAQRPPAAMASKERIESTLTGHYAAMDSAYGRHDAGGFYEHHAPDFRFVNIDGGTDTLPRSQKYMSMRFSPSHPKRFLSCSISQRVVSVKAVNSMKCRAVVNQVVFTETQEKGKMRTEIRQEDTWRNDSGHWRCVRSHILSRSATPL